MGIYEEITKRFGECRGKDRVTTLTALVLPFVELHIRNSEISKHDDFSFTAQASMNYYGIQKIIDVVIKRHDQPVIFMIVKPIGSYLPDSYNELATVFNASPTVGCGMVTNGEEYHIFVNKEAPYIMDSQPYDIIYLGRGGEVWTKNLWEEGRAINFIAEIFERFKWHEWRVQ